MEENRFDWDLAKKEARRGIDEPEVKPNEAPKPKKLTAGEIKDAVAAAKRNGWIRPGTP